MTVSELVGSIKPIRNDIYILAQKRWDSIAKPLGSLGLMEDIVCRIAAARETLVPDKPRKAVVVMCSDNGVVEEGVTQTGQEVTAVVTENMSKGQTSVCAMSRAAGAEVFPVDIGVYRETVGERIISRPVRRGTSNMTKGPAMSRAEAETAIITGAQIVRELRDKGFTLIATGEMGIGNTTTSSAVASVLLGLDASKVTGRGAGLSDEGLRRKIAAIEKAVALNMPDRDDPIDVLSKVGGFDICGLCGVFLGGAAYGVPIIIDGFISGIAALAAARICPDALSYMLASHVSAEPAGLMVLEALKLHPPIHAGMSLGEGTGAVMLMPMIDMALNVYRDMPTFEETSIEAYTPLS